jgi:acyl carrier protein
MGQNESRMNEDLLEIEEKLKLIVISHLNLDMAPEQINPEEENFLDALGFNSYDALRLLVIAETEFGVEIHDDDLSASLFKTLRSLATYFYNLKNG